ncbi:hypothetical protein C0991_008180 [Blastosporella zonata]|nr:hypothetical protein C0991_008180 [Blastosporella zonata]
MVRNVPCLRPFQLLLLALSAFVVYTVAFCHDDLPQKSPVCKAFDSYRTHIIDPYIKPPIERLIHHSEPYIDPLKPYASATTAYARARVIPRASALLDTSLAHYDAQVAPRLHWLVVDRFWNGITKPLYFDNLHPYLERHTRPHRIFYHKVIVPGARKVVSRTHSTYIRVLPHAQHYLVNAQANAGRIYETVRPHVLRVYQRVRPHAVVLLNQAQLQLLCLTKKAGDMRREFVDPHLRKILDKVGENGDPADSPLVAPVLTESETTPHPFQMNPPLTI